MPGGSSGETAAPQPRTTRSSQRLKRALNDKPVLFTQQPANTAHQQQAPERSPERPASSLAAPPASPDHREPAPCSTVMQQCAALPHTAAGTPANSPAAAAVAIAEVNQPPAALNGESGRVARARRKRSSTAVVDNPTDAGDLSQPPSHNRVNPQQGQQAAGRHFRAAQAAASNESGDTQQPSSQLEEQRQQQQRPQRPCRQAASAAVANRPIETDRQQQLHHSQGSDRQLGEQRLVKRPRRSAAAAAADTLTQQQCSGSEQLLQQQQHVQRFTSAAADTEPTQQHSQQPIPQQQQLQQEEQQHSKRPRRYSAAAADTLMQQQQSGSEQRQQRSHDLQQQQQRQDAQQPSTSAAAGTEPTQQHNKLSMQQQPEQEQQQQSKRPRRFAAAAAAAAIAATAESTPTKQRRRRQQQQQQQQDTVSNSDLSEPSSSSSSSSGEAYDSSSSSSEAGSPADSESVDDSSDLNDAGDLRSVPVNLGPQNDQTGHKQRSTAGRRGRSGLRQQTLDFCDDELDHPQQQQQQRRGRGIGRGRLQGHQHEVTQLQQQQEGEPTGVLNKEQEVLLTAAAAAGDHMQQQQYGGAAGVEVGVPQLMADSQSQKQRRFDPRPLSDRGPAQRSLDRYKRQQQTGQQQQQQQGQFRSVPAFDLRNKTPHHLVCGANSPTAKLLEQKIQQQQLLLQQQRPVRGTGFLYVKNSKNRAFFSVRLPAQMLKAPNLGTFETAELAARAADLAGMAVLGVNKGMKLNFPLDSYTLDERQQRSGPDLDRYLRDLRGGKFPLNPAAAAEMRRYFDGAIGRSGQAAAAAGKAQRRQQQGQERRCGLCTGCLSGRLCVLVVWKRHRASSAAVGAKWGGKSTARHQKILHTFKLQTELAGEHARRLALEQPTAAELVLPLRPAAAALAAAPRVAAAAAAASAGARSGAEQQRAVPQPAALTAAAAPSGQQQVAAAAAAAAAAALAGGYRPAAAAAAEPASGAFLAHYGNLPVHQEPEKLTGIEPLRPATRPGLRVQQQLSSAAAAAAAGLACIHVTEDEIPVRRVCNSCESMQHTATRVTHCSVHRHLVHAAAAAPAGSEQQGLADVAAGSAQQGLAAAADHAEPWVQALGPEGVRLVSSLRDMADDILGDEVRRLKERERVAGNVRGAANQLKQQQQRRQGQGHDAVESDHQQQQQQLGKQTKTGRKQSQKQQQQQQEEEEEEEVAAAAGSSAAAARKVPVSGDQQQQQPLGLDPWSFVATAVLLQELSTELLQPQQL